MKKDKKVSIFKAFTKKTKGITSNVLKELSFNGSIQESKKIIDKLKNDACPHFEVKNNETKQTTVYKRSISGKNYEVKQV